MMAIDVTELDSPRLVFQGSRFRRLEPSDCPEAR